MQDLWSISFSSRSVSPSIEGHMRAGDSRGCCLCDFSLFVRDFSRAAGPMALAGKGEPRPSQTPKAITEGNFGKAPAAT